MASPSSPSGGASHQKLKARVEALLEAWKFKEAAAELQKLAEVPELRGYAAKKLEEAKNGPREAKANAASLARTARKLVDAHDFQGAVELLDDFPKRYRTKDFVEVAKLARAKAEDVADREFAIEQLLLNGEFDDLKKPVAELLDVQPTNRLGRKLKAAMEGTAKAGSRLDIHGTVIELDKMSKSSDGVFSGFLPIAVAVAVVGAGTTWGLMHLMWAAPSLTAKFSIEAELLDGRYAFFVDGEEREPDILERGLAGLAAGQHEIIVRRDGEVVARNNVDVPAADPETIFIAVRGGNVIIATEAPEAEVVVANGGALQPGEVGVFGGDETISFRWCPPGTFTMGSPVGESGRGEGEDQVDVTISTGFWMAHTVVTQRQYEDVMGTQPWSGEADVQVGATYPATYVSWTDATEFCSKLTESDRRTGRLPAGWRYRLPTEAEWEYACRAGTTTAFSFGINSSRLSEYGWFDKNSNDVGEAYAHQVGLKEPNPWGLFDMHGNVWEWCSDWDAVKLAGGRDPEGPKAGSKRITRGGSWHGITAYSRSAHRGQGEPSVRTPRVGFRLLLEPSEN